MLDGEKAAFLLGIEQFNREEFFAAHETWETIWIAASGSDKIFLQGIIQLAAALHHWRGGNRRGSLSLVRHGLEKLAAFPRSYRGVCVDRLREQAACFAEVLSRDQAIPRVRLPRIDLDSAPHSDGDSQSHAAS